MVFDMGNYMNFANKTAHEIFSTHENLKMIATSCKACTANYCEYLIAMLQNFAYLCSGMSRAGQAVSICLLSPAMHQNKRSNAPTGQSNNFFSS